MYDVPLQALFLSTDSKTSNHDACAITAAIKDFQQTNAETEEKAEVALRTEVAQNVENVALAECKSLRSPEERIGINDQEIGLQAGAITDPQLACTDVQGNPEAFDREGSGAEVHVPERAQSVPPGISLFTASGKPITIDKSLSKAAHIFADLDQPYTDVQNPERPASASTRPEPATPAFHLMTASGKPLQVGSAAIKRGQEFLSEMMSDGLNQQPHTKKQSFEVPGPYLPLGPQHRLASSSSIASGNSEGHVPASAMKEGEQGQSI